ncbi:MAG: AMP-binding protein [Spirochaetaceae bacterium]|jgi:long-chain acyl-CoA synthetase|nr:AMP-binding protein [Spirochaetaceae bacterium]
MIDPKLYMADYDDFPYPNFIAFLDDIEARFQNDPAFLYRAGKQKDFTVRTYRQFAADCRRVARGLLAAGLTKHDRVILWSENRLEWPAIWLGAAIAGCTIVPVDFLISDEECLNIITFTKAKAAFFSPLKAQFAASDQMKNTSLTTTVIIDESFSRFGQDADGQPLPAADAIKETDPCSMVFTSGTTGLSKGVVLSHKGIIANCSAAIIMLQPKKEDVFISVLPMHHTYPTTCSFLAPLAYGVKIVVVEKLVGQVIVNDIRDTRGTFVIAVPLLFDKMMAAIDAKYKKLPVFVRAPLDTLRRISLAEANKGNPDFGRKVFRFLRRKAGLDSIQIMVAGGGPLSVKTADFFDSLGFNIVQGYGMSENSPLISVSTPRYKNNASVGLPVKYTDVRIADQDDDTTYLKTGEEGEIFVKSPSLMLGYYENPQATAEMFSREGFLKTGDLGYINEDGFIFINGRKKNLIVSAGGKNIYPEEIEACFDNSRVIGEILVIGRKSEETGEIIFALVYPNYETLQAKYGGKADNKEFVKTLIKKEIAAVNRNLPVYKKIADWMLFNTEFEKNAQKKIKRFLYKDYEDSAKTPIL